MEQTIGIELLAFAFGDAGGVTDDTRPSTMRKGQVAYSFTNRSYNQRVLATYNTGLSESGWASCFQELEDVAEEGIIDGTFYDSWGYFPRIEKKFNERHNY